MKKRIIATFGWLVLCAVAAAQAQDLESVLNSMDKAASSFHTAQADFVADQYQKVVDDHDFQKGTIYFPQAGGRRRDGCRFHLTRQEVRSVFRMDSLAIFSPPSTRSPSNSAGKNKADFESFLVLGFGGRGHDLQKSYDLRFGGMESVQGVSAAKLELTRSLPR